MSESANVDEGTTISVQLTPDLLAALDKFAERDDVGSRSEAARLILKLWLEDNQMLESGQKGTRPEDLNASNDD